MKTVQQRAPSTATDFSSAIHRNHVLNHVVLAEINYFQKEKVNDLNSYMKILIDEQIQFYQKVNSFLNFFFSYQDFLFFRSLLNYKMHQEPLNKYRLIFVYNLHAFLILSSFNLFIHYFLVLLLS
jgi:hypothetical protein